MSVEKPMHQMHIANTIAKRRRELIAQLTDVEISEAPEDIRTAGRLNALTQFVSDMSELEKKIRGDFP